MYGSLEISGYLSVGGEDLVAGCRGSEAGGAVGVASAVEATGRSGSSAVLGRWVGVGRPVGIDLEDLLLVPLDVLRKGLGGFPMLPEAGLAVGLIGLIAAEARECALGHKEAEVRVPLRSLCVGRRLRGLLQLVHRTGEGMEAPLGGLATGCTRGESRALVYGADNRRHERSKGNSSGAEASLGGSPRGREALVAELSFQLVDEATEFFAGHRVGGGRVHC